MLRTEASLPRHSHRPVRQQRAVQLFAVFLNQWAPNTSPTGFLFGCKLLQCRQLGPSIAHNCLCSCLKFFREQSLNPQKTPLKQAKAWEWVFVNNRQQAAALATPSTPPCQDANPIRSPLQGKPFMSPGTSGTLFPPLLTGLSIEAMPSVF